MKKLFLTITALSALTFTSVAQTENKTGAASTELTLEQKVDKETAKAATNLNLTDAQKVKFKQFTTERVTANKPLRAKAKASTDKAEKKAIHAQIKANHEKYFANVNGILTPEQQKTWANHKKKVDEKQGRQAQHD